MEFRYIHRATRIKAVFTSILLVLFLFTNGCGVYTFSGNVPGHLKTIAIATFENQTAEFGIVEILTEAVEEKFRSDNTLKLRDQKNADSILHGIITGINDRVSTYNLDETPEEYKITLTVLVKFEDRVKNKIIWEESLSAFGIYPFSGGSSAEREAGLEEAVVKLSEDILNKTVSGW
jgi:hypothetical protein